MAKIDLPPAVVRAFVKDMRAYFADQWAQAGRDEQFRCAAPGYANVPSVARPPMPFCSTLAGAFGPDQSLNFPAGTPCWWALPNGQVFNGQIVWG